MARHALLALTAGLTLAVTTPALATDYPLQLENCGRALTFDAAPERVVSVGQSGTEMLYALGLGDKVIGTSVWFNDVLEEFADIDAKVERLAANDPSFESVVATKPDLVTTMFEWHIGPTGVVGTRDQFGELGIETYVMPADCVGKNNLVGGDGARTSQFQIDTVYQAIEDLAAIFDVEDAGAALEADLKGRLQAASEKAKALGLNDASAVVWFSSAEMQLDPYVAGQKGIPGFIMRQLGIRNVIQSDEEWPTVGWETIAKADPTIIAIARMDRRRYAADDVETKLEFLKTDPVASQMTAVKEGRIIVIDAEAMHASIRIADGIEAFVEALEASGTAQ